jgi:hypothetical protein
MNSNSVLGIVSGRQNPSSSSRGFWDSILWIRPFGMSIDCVTIFLREYCIQEPCVFEIAVL